MINKKIVKFAKIFILVTLLIVGCNQLTQAPPHQPKDSSTIRGVWLTHVGNAFYAYTGQLDNVFHQLSRLNFNRVYISVYNDGVTYPTNVSFQNHLVSLSLINPLNKAIKEGKRQGLKVYAWYEYGLMLNPSDAIAKKHPDWLLENGKVVNNFVWLNPKNPEVQSYFTKLFTEVAYLYPDLVGIQLDDHWGIPKALGNYTDSLTQLTGKIAQTIKKIHPDWIISLSPNPPSFSYRFYSQDWLEWVRKGYIDEVVVQIYRNKAKQVQVTLSHSGLKEASHYVPVAAGIFAGFVKEQDGKLKSLVEVQKQINTIQESGYGYALFTYEYTLGFFRMARTKIKESFFD
ncbi:MAG: glycoside hydrolase family 10 protein [Microcystaceae cyanobacterium]